MSKQNLQNGRPPVPDWIREFSCRGWTNVFRHLPNEDHLYGTETLIGFDDWNSRVLLLAKDWGPTSALTSGLGERDSRPWRHAVRGDPGGWRTNEKLVCLASDIPGGKLYGSATANMLCDARGWSRTLKGWKHEPLQGFLQCVLGWVLESMPRVEQVACLGNEAWFLTCMTIGNPSSACQCAEHRKASRPVSGKVGKKKIIAFPLYHPAARVSDDVKKKGWRALAASLSN